MHTSPASPSSRAERFAPWLAGAVIALPTLLTRYPPMADLPLHEAVVGLLRHWGDPRFVPADVYELNLGRPNQLFYFVILALSYPLGVTCASKVTVAATLLLLPVACAKLADYLGVTRWAAVVLAPLGLGWMYFWGLLANMIALDLYVLALPSLDRFCQRPTPRGLLVACGWVALLHFTHDLLALTAGGTLCVLTVCGPRGLRDLRTNLLRLAPVALVVVLVLAERAFADTLKSGHAKDQPLFVSYGIGHKLATFPGVLYGGYTAWVRDVICAVCFAPTLMFAYERWRHRRRAMRTWPERLHHFRLEIVGLLLFVGYLLAPTNMGSTTLIYHRLLPPAWILLALCAARGQRPGPPWRLPRLVAAFVPLVPLLTSWPKFVESDHAYRDLDAIIDRMQGNSTSAVLELGPTNDNWLSTPVTGSGHIVARLGGRSLFDYTESPVAPVHIRTDRFWNHLYERIDGHAYRFMPPFDLTRFRYAILHTTDASIAELVTLAMQPEARFVTRIGEWTLLESTLPLVPIDAPDALVPLPHPLTLRKRVVALAETMNGGSLPPEPPALPTPSTSEP